MAVTRILSGVDDITINGSNKNRASCKKEEIEQVSLVVMLVFRLRCDCVALSVTVALRAAGTDVEFSFFFIFLPFFVFQYDDEDERNGLTQGDKLRALKSKRQARSSTGSLS